MLEKFIKYIKYLIFFLRFYFGYFLDNLFLKSNKKCIFYYNKYYYSVWKLLYFIRVVKRNMFINFKIIFVGIKICNYLKYIFYIMF